MKVAVRGLALERVLPLLWAHGLAVAGDGEDGDVLLCSADAQTAGPPRVVWTVGPMGLREVWPAALVCSPPRAALSPAIEPAADAPLAEVLAAMRHDYTRQLPEALGELARAVIAAQRGAPITDARMLAHRMRGTAGTYGHPEVGAAAARLEDQLLAGDLATTSLATSLLGIAARVVAALWPSRPSGSRLIVVGAPPPGVPTDMLVHAPDLAAAASMAGQDDALWFAGDDPTALAGRPVLADVPVAVVREPTGAVARTALACLRPDPWTRLFAPVPGP